MGYRVENSVQITARQVAQFGGLLDALVQAGANQIHGITFRVSEPEKLLDEARKLAMADARRKAEALAGEAEVVVGPPLKIQEGGGPPPPMPLFARAPMMVQASVPLTAGELELSVTVHVVYRLQEAKRSP